MITIGVLVSLLLFSFYAIFRLNEYGLQMQDKMEEITDELNVHHMNIVEEEERTRFSIFANKIVNIINK